MDKLEHNINIAYFWFESAIHMDDPKLVWHEIERAFDNPPTGPQYITI